MMLAHGCPTFQSGLKSRRPLQHQQQTPLVQTATSCSGRFQNQAAFQSGSARVHLDRDQHRLPRGSTAVVFARPRKSQQGGGSDDDEDWEDPDAAALDPSAAGLLSAPEEEDFGDDDDILGGTRRAQGDEADEEPAEQEEDEDVLDEDETIDRDDSEYDEDMEPADDDEEEEDEDIDLPPSDSDRVVTMDLRSAIRERDVKRVSVSEVVQLDREEVDRMAQEKAEADAKKNAVVIPENSQLALNRQGYQAFEMDGVDFLVSETPDGRMDLADTFYFDESLQLYARPKQIGVIPEGPRLLQILPWIERKTPDTLKGKAGFAKMKKVYMIRILTQAPKHTVDMREVYCFEASSRTLTCCAVRTIGEPVDPVLRIRADEITIEDSATAPNPSEVSQSKAWEEVDSAQDEEARLQRIEDLESQAEQMDELEDMPDAPVSDMM